MRRNKFGIINLLPLLVIGVVVLVAGVVLMGQQSQTTGGDKETPSRTNTPAQRARIQEINEKLPQTTELNELTAEQAAGLPLFPPIVNTETVQTGTRIFWSGTGVDVATGYSVYRRTTNTEDWLKVGERKLEGNNRGDYEFIDTDIQESTPYEYRVSIINFSGDEYYSETVSP